MTTSQVELVPTSQNELNLWQHVWVELVPTSWSELNLCSRWTCDPHLETVKRVGLIWPVNWRERAILPASSDWSSQIQMNQSELVLSPYAYIRHVSKYKLVALQVLTLNSNKVIVHLNSLFSAIIALKVYICIRTNFACTEVFKGIF